MDPEAFEQFKVELENRLGNLCLMAEHKYGSVSWKKMERDVLDFCVAVWMEDQASYKLEAKQINEFFACCDLVYQAITPVRYWRQ